MLANPLNAVQTAVDKAKTKRFLADKGFPATQGRICRSHFQAVSIAESYGYPVVIKALDQSGGVGLRIAFDREELGQLIEEGETVLIEKFVSGPEFSVEVLNYGGNALPLLPVFKNYTGYAGIHPMERVKVAPAPIHEISIARLRKLAKQVVQTLDCQPTADVDIVWGEDGPQILEINPRFGGVTALSMAACGITVYEALVDMVLGIWDPRNYRFDRHIAADLPVASDLANSMIKRLLDLEGVFRVKVQKLKQTTGRIAVKAKTREELLATAAEVAAICKCWNCLTELESLLSKTQVTTGHLLSLEDENG